MTCLDEMEIFKFMNLKQTISELKIEKMIKYKEYYQQSFYTSTHYTGYEIFTKAIRPEQAVCELDKLMALIDKRIAIAEARLNYWMMFLNGLSRHERHYFTRKYVDGHLLLNNRLEKLAVEEIKEIQVAITFQFGYRDEDTDKIELVHNDYLSNIHTILNEVGGV